MSKKPISADNFAAVMKRGNWTKGEIVKLRWRLRYWERMLATHEAISRLDEQQKREARQARRLGLVFRGNCWIDPETEKRSKTMWKL